MWKKLLYYGMPILKVLLFLVFFILCSYPFVVIASYNLISEKWMGLLGFTILSESILIFIVISALLMVMKIFKEYGFADIYIVRKHVVSGFAKGALIGFGLLCACSLFALAGGNVSFEVGEISIGTFFGYVIFYIMVGIFEEFFFRAFPLHVFAERYPIYLAIFLTSMFFGLAHLSNPGFTWLAMINITLAGALFAILVLIKKNIFWAAGIHFGWNFTQGPILGYKVSGTYGGGLLRAEPIGPSYLSGGNFGVEGSIYCSVTMLLLIVILLRHYKIKNYSIPNRKIAHETPE